MKLHHIVKGTLIEPDKEYLVQVANLGIEGKVSEVKDNKLVLLGGRTYDLREVIAFGYEKAPKFDFSSHEVSLDSIRVIHKI